MLIFKEITSLLEMSISTAKLVIWLHWQLIWVLFLKVSSQPLEDQAPVPPILQHTHTHAAYESESVHSKIHYQRQVE